MELAAEAAALTSQASLSVLSASKLQRFFARYCTALQLVAQLAPHQPAHLDLSTTRSRAATWMDGQLGWPIQLPKLDTVLE